jgi:hypothetical protein
MTSADFCPLTPCVATWLAAFIAVRFGGSPTPFEMALTPTPIARQAAPWDRFPRIRTFTLLNSSLWEIQQGKLLPPERSRRVLTYPETGPCMPFLLVRLWRVRRLIALHSGFLRTIPRGSAPRGKLGISDLPSASTSVNMFTTLTGFTYRGLSSDKFTPMPGVHHCVQPARTSRAAD